MDYYLFQLLEGADIEEVQRELEKKGLTNPFIIEDDSNGTLLLGGQSKKNLKTSQAILVEKKPAAVDWNEQWALFAEDFKEGKAHIQLGEKTLLLTPGAGFGDLSHPTTALMLEMMKQRVKGESVVDIGTGSGILALAALFLGAKKAVGIDIDPQALKHAKENAKLNQLKASFSRSIPKKLPKQNIFLMNMIFPEQLEFDPKRFNNNVKLWIISGILKDQKKTYLKQAAAWNWNLIQEYEQSEWMGFIFNIKT